MNSKVADFNEVKNVQWIALTILRVFIGWHLMYEGIAKVINPTWTSAYYLEQSNWIFSGIFKSIAANQSWLSAVDFINQWLLVLTGVLLVLGLFSRTASLVGAVLLLLYYLVQPPLFEITSVSSDGSNLIVNKVLIESVALMCLAFFPTGKVFGLDRILYLKQNRNTNG